MPTENNWWKKIQKLFIPSTTIDLLEIELKKNPAKQSLYRITALVKTLCLKKAPISPSLLQAYPILIQALTNIIQETPFDKKIIYHDTHDDYEEAIKQVGEVHCLLQYKKEPLYYCVITYTAIGFIAYDPYLLIQRDNQYEHYTIVNTAQRSIVIETAYSQNYLEQSLTQEGITLTNIPLIAHARQELENYYYNLGNNASRQSDANNINDINVVPAIMFSHLKTSSEHPEEMYTALEKEKQQEKEGNSICICTKVMA